MNKLSYVNLYTTDPAFNLAAEQYVFDSLPRDRSWFMLWQNDNAVIIGKYQNAYAEVNEEVLRRRGIKLVRRLSGGGAVYHDLGNLNYTFITDAGDAEGIDLHSFCLPVVRALREMGVPAEINGRNDMTVDGKKFSGNAQYLKDGRVMHHGTLMLASDLSVLGEVLNPDREKVEAKGIKSVKSRVTNLSDYFPRPVSAGEFRSILIKSIAGPEGEEYVLTPEDIEAVEKIKKSRYDTWDWNRGRSPECSIKKSRRIEGCGRVEAWITLDKGIITGLEFTGDFFSAEEPEKLSQKLTGLKYDPDTLSAALSAASPEKYFKGITAPALLSILF